MGANGVVYLVEYQGGYYAMKVSESITSLTSEMNVLKSFSKVQGPSLGPYLLHGDDWLYRGTTYPFYIMEYIEGKDVSVFLREKGPEWVEVLMLQLLTSLDHLHGRGWVFGDLKPENLLVTDPGFRVRCVDVGGTTQIGRSIKEFTEFFDRGYWGLGSRKAEPSYDLFAVAMIFINAYYPDRFKKTQDPFGQLAAAINDKKQLAPYKNVLLRALQGKYGNAKEMRAGLLVAVQEKGSHTQQRSAAPRKRSQSKKKKSHFGEWVVLLFLICCLYGFYLYIQIAG